MSDDSTINAPPTQLPANLYEEELDEKYPNRPRNHSRTLPFHELFTTLFTPLLENKKKPTGRAIARKKQGPHGPSNLTPNEIRRNIIDRFISRWRKEVGDDIFPAIRLILPDKDRERAMYGLKEKAIGKFLVRLMKIDKNSEDAFNLLNWKLPGQHFSSMAGDFAGRCHEVLMKRPLRTALGDMTIDEVNEKLDQLSRVQKEEHQLPIMQEFYRRMNPEEMMWLIRIILRQMKIGATEKTILDLWHPDAEALFNVSSNLRRVCWELYDINVKLGGDETDIALMQCFQPQLAQFQMRDFETMVKKMEPTDEDPVFWIEEKLDGERIQLHMVEDNTQKGGKRFAFWSRKAKDYTYLYGNGLFDDKSALTRHLKSAFHEGVRNIILDGEMITWDPEVDKIVGFGTLKTAALSEQNNPYSSGHRPLFRVFDILYLNDKALTKYTLRERRKALDASLKTVHRRFEIHKYTEASSAGEIEPLLRQVVAEASEGLVMKNPRSMYRLNERNDNWVKVKPEYMTEFGEALDCVVIGGYYGSGRRGGGLSSFLCGLRVDQPNVDPQKCFSFFKVGGGMTAGDYAAIRHQTEGKWKDWDKKDPPLDYIELGGGDRQFERPDVWIKPADSVVVSVKAASVAGTDQFRMGFTLRFPRFKRLRTDRDWSSALSIQSFIELRHNAEHEAEKKKFTIDIGRKAKVARTSKKKPLVVAGGGEPLINANISKPENRSLATFLTGLTFYIMSEAMKPIKKSKAELETLVKMHGGKLMQTAKESNDMICIADRELISVVSLRKHGYKSIVRPSWLIDCLKQAERDINGYGRESALLLPFEPRHMLFIKSGDEDMLNEAADQWGDGYASDIKDVQQMRMLLDSMPAQFDNDESEPNDFAQELAERGHEFTETTGGVFDGCVICFESDALEDVNSMEIDTGLDTPNKESNGYNPMPEDFKPNSLSRTRDASTIIRFAKGIISKDINDPTITHIVMTSDDHSKARQIRQLIMNRPRLPRLVAFDWVWESWREKTLLDEERFAVS